MNCDKVHTVVQKMATVNWDVGQCLKACITYMYILSKVHNTKLSMEANTLALTTVCEHMRIMCPHL